MAAGGGGREGEEMDDVPLPLTVHTDDMSDDTARVGCTVPPGLGEYILFAPSL